MFVYREPKACDVILYFFLFFIKKCVDLDEAFDPSHDIDRLRIERKRQRKKEKKARWILQPFHGKKTRRRVAREKID